LETDFDTIEFAFEFEIEIEIELICHPYSCAFAQTFCFQSETIIRKEARVRFCDQLAKERVGQSTKMVDLVFYKNE
jgi:hypothetical protein